MLEGISINLLNDYFLNGRFEYSLLSILNRC
jgi:hypothetical protein